MFYGYVLMWGGIILIVLCPIVVLVTVWRFIHKRNKIRQMLIEDYGSEIHQMLIEDYRGKIHRK